MAKFVRGLIALIMGFLLQTIILTVFIYSQAAQQESFIKNIEFILKNGLSGQVTVSLSGIAWAGLMSYLVQLMILGSNKDFRFALIGRNTSWNTREWVYLGTFTSFIYPPFGTWLVNLVIDIVTLRWLFWITEVAWPWFLSLSTPMKFVTGIGLLIAVVIGIILFFMVKNWIANLGKSMTSDDPDSPDEEGGKDGDDSDDDSDDDDDDDDSDDGEDDGEDDEEPEEPARKSRNPFKRGEQQPKAAPKPVAKPAAKAAPKPVPAAKSAPTKKK